jgi:hypothetical protein
MICAFLFDLYMRKYKITSVLKIKKDIIASIAASPTGRPVILVIMSVVAFRNDVIVVIGDVKISTDNFQHQNQFLRMRVTN